MFITQQGLLRVFRIGCEWILQIRLSSSLKIHDRSHKIRRKQRKTDVLCNKHIVSNLMLRYPF